SCQTHGSVSTREIGCPELSVTAGIRRVSPSASTGTVEISEFSRMKVLCPRRETMYCPATVAARSAEVSSGCGASSAAGYERSANPCSTASRSTVEESAAAPDPFRPMNTPELLLRIDLEGGMRMEDVAAVAQDPVTIAILREEARCHLQPGREIFQLRLAEAGGVHGGERLLRQQR